MNEVEPPRISRDRAAVVVVVGLAVAGAAVGVLWAYLAPPVHGVVALTRGGDRVQAHLGNESDNYFVAAFLVVGMLCVMAVVAAMLVWQWRAHRGPMMVSALAVGAAAAAGAATGVGAMLVHWRYGTIDIAAAPISPEHRVHYVVEAPAVFFGQSPLTGRRDDSVSSRGRGAGLCVDGGGDGPRRPGCVAAGRTTGVRPARHSGERSTVRPVITLAAILASRPMPT